MANYTTQIVDGFDSSVKYEEFLADSDECPTCRGLGRIRKDDDHLVALIPVSDSRLKPSKTWLFVVIAVILCLLLGGLLLFFLISRSVSVDSDVRLIIPNNVMMTNTGDIVKDKNLNIFFTVPINISNQNYLPVHVTSLKLSTVVFADRVLASTTNITDFVIPMRGNHTHLINVTIILDHKEYPSVINECQSSSILNKLFMNFEITATVSYLSHTESSSATLYNRKVCCKVGNYTTACDSGISGRGIIDPCTY